MRCQREPGGVGLRPIWCVMHSEWFDLISAGADGELDATESERLSAHLASCARCAAVFAGFEAERRRHRFRIPRAPADLVTEVLEARSQQQSVDDSSRSTLVRRATAAASAAAAVAIAVCLATGQQAPIPPLPARPLATRIAVTDRSVHDAAIEVEAGTTVEWRNSGSATHQLVRVLGAVTVDDELAPGRGRSARFDRAGTYRYYCTIHPEIAGTINVRG